MITHNIIATEASADVRRIKPVNRTGIPTAEKLRRTGELEEEVEQHFCQGCDDIADGFRSSS